jgi:hypothetical protein
LAVGVEEKMKQSEILGCGGMGLGWVQNSRGGGGEEKEEEDLDYIIFLGGEGPGHFEPRPRAGKSETLKEIVENIFKKKTRTSRRNKTGTVGFHQHHVLDRFSTAATTSTSITAATPTPDHPKNIGLHPFTPHVTVQIFSNFQFKKKRRRRGRGRPIAHSKSALFVAQETEARHYFSPCLAFPKPSP